MLSGKELASVIPVQPVKVTVEPDALLITNEKLYSDEVLTNTAILDTLGRVTDDAPDTNVICFIYQ